MLIYFDLVRDFPIQERRICTGECRCNNFQTKTKHMSEAEKIKKLLEEQVKTLKHKREEVLSRVRGELDDIDRALKQLGHAVPPSDSAGGGKQKRRGKVDDAQIMAVLRGFMKPGESYSASEIQKRADIKAPRFASFRTRQKDFLKTHGAKRSMRYSLNA
jgi:hypothetical protein